MIAEFTKRGQGAFRVLIEDNLETKVTFEGPPMTPASFTRTFHSPRGAYDHYRPMTEGNHTYWSICYHLEDYLEEKPRNG